MKHLAVIITLSATAALTIVGCKKDKSDSGDIETTFTLSENQAAGEAVQDDANTVFFEAATDKGLMRTTEGAQVSQTLSCATVTVTPLSGFPKTIVVDFGSGCTSIDGVNRSGKINIVLSDSVRKSGSTAVMTFDNYKVAGYKLEGTITWTNTSTPNGFSWTRQIANGKVTAPSGNYYWLHTGNKAVTQTAGSATPLNVLDDVFSITGNHTVTNPAGVSRTATITEALEKKTTCANISKGKLRIEGPSHFAIVDYGDGTCDRVATISIDGRTPRTFLLPY